MGIRTGRPRGRPKGSPNKASVERQKAVAASGITPLEYMLAMLRDELATAEDRKWAAAQAAPYVHPRLAQVDQSVTHGVSDELADLLNAIDSKTRGVPNVDNGHRPTATSH